MNKHLHAAIKYCFLSTSSLLFSFSLYAQTGPAGVSSGIKLWLDGSNVNNTSPATNPVNNTAVATWKDISGNNNNATVFGGQTAGTMNSSAINGHDVVKFTRTAANAGSVYNVAGVDIRKGTMPKMTVFTMYRPGVRNPGEQHALWGDDNGAYDRFIYSGYIAAAGGFSDGNVLSIPLFYLSNTHVPGTPKLLTAVYDSANVNTSAVYLDGLFQNNFTDSTDNTNAQTTLRIGWDGNDGNYNGDIAEMVVYNRVLTDCERKAVTRYFALKYGLPFSSASIVGEDTVNTILCTGNPVTLTASTGTSYQWLNNNTVIGGATNPTFTTTNAGNYSVIVTTNGCPDTSATRTVSLVNIATSSQILYTPDTTISCGDSTTLYVLPAHNNGKDILTTGGAANNQREGNMFDIFADNPVTIEGFDVNVLAGTCLYSIYTRPGTHVGFEGNATGWTLLGTFNLTGNGFGTYTRLPMKIGVPIAQGQTQAFYLTVEAGGLTTGYFNGTNVGDTWAQDNNIRVLDGTGRNNVFGGAGGSFTPRCFIGRVHYKGWPLPLWNTGAVNDTIKIIPPVTADYSVILGWSQSGCSAVDTQKIVVIPDTMYVDAAIPVSGTGKSWASPFKTVTEALSYANRKTCNTSIWVKKGTYYPMLADLVTVASNRDSSFRVLRPDLKIYGGFAGTETAVSQRNIAANPTILSGDIGTPNNNSDNCYHVMTVVPNDAVNGVTIDGFTIQGASARAVAGNFTVNAVAIPRLTGGGIYANNSNLTVNNSILQHNSTSQGGGIYSITGGSILTLANDSIADNLGADLGGGICTGNAAVNMDNTSFVRDTSDFGAGAYTSGAGNAVVNNCRFLFNKSGINVNSGGGGYFANGTPVATIKYCTFYGNNAMFNTAGSGAGFQQSAGTASNISNCVFANNNALGTADDAGGGIMVYGGTTTISDCTFSENLTASTVKPNGNAISAVAGTTVNFNNSIAWGTAPVQMYTLGTINYLNSDVGGLAATGTNINANPEFINPADPDGADNVWGTADDGLNLVVCAPPANRGSNALIPGGITTDMAASPRIQQAVVDMGAYESNLTTAIAYVDGGVTTNGNGTSWASPFKTLSQALDVANFSNCVSEIWVKQGTYLPMITPTVVATNRDSSFRILRSGIKVFGGFAGTETLLSQRNITANPTILSGDIGVTGNNSDNLYHVLTVTPNDPAGAPVIVNGFTVRDGGDIAASGSVTVSGVTVTRNTGGGIFIKDVKLNLDSNIISWNRTLYGGGVFATGAGELNMANDQVTDNAGSLEGGGIFSDGAHTFILNNSSFIRDSADFGGGIFTRSAITADKIQFLHNQSGYSASAATGGGGGIYTQNVTLATFNQCIFEDNIAQSASSTLWGGAGGLLAESPGGIANLNNCVFANNKGIGTADDGGGAIINFGGVINVNGCTFSENITNSTVKPNSNAISSLSGTTVNINNSIIWGTAANQVQLLGPVAYAFSDVKGVAASGSNINTDPLFVNAADADGADNIWGTADDGLKLINCSPAINTGSNALIPAVVTADITTGPRIIQAIVDMGAYENTYITPPTQSVTIGASQTTICAGTLVTFTATPANGGATPAYQWQVNGVNAGTNSNTFTTTTLVNGDIVTVIMTSSLVCILPTPSTTSNSITMTVNPNLTPSVSIAITAGAQTICANTSVTFTATPVNGGTTPAYQWQVNGINAGTNSNTFTTTTLANGDIVTVIMTSNFNCLASNNPVSNAITMTVNPNLTPTVSIAITTGAQIICAGTSVTFTATPTNGGTTPVYQWKVNGTNAGTNSNTFTSNTLANGDIVTVIMTSNFNCLASNNPVSNAITMTVNPNLTPTVAIVASQTTICAGAPVTFTATPVNGGTTPSYQWQVNGINAGTNSNIFTSNTLANGDIVTVIMTSNFNCLASNNPVSNAITMSVNTNLTPSVSIAITTGAQMICAGTSVTFTAAPVNGGTTPAYQWQVNGVNAGTNSSTFTSTTFANSDIVTCVMTSNSGCLASNNPVSNAITMTVNPNLTPTVSIAITAGAQTICANTSVTFTATAVNGGTTPAYQWQVNGVNAGTNSSTFTSTTFANSDIVTCVMTSNSGCLVSNNPVSNAITMTVNPNLTPAVSIAITAGSQTTCVNSSVTFTATPTNGGTAPVYQWQVNGVNAGTNSNIYTDNTFANGDIITCIMTSNAGCLASNNPVSNPITLTVNNNLVPSVSIAITSGAQTICAGASVTFTATPVNGGATPSYQWQISGGNAGTNSNTFTINSLLNGDVITVILNSSVTCLVSNNPVSNAITMAVNPILTPSVSVVASQTVICAGTLVTFTATATNGGTAPVYQWKVNGVNAGTNSNTFSSTTLANSDVVTCVMTSNEACLASNNPVSNAITMTVNPNLTPTISIAITTGAQTICANTAVVFTATTTNGGTAPVYQWKVNGVNAGTNSNTFASTTFVNGDIITCVLTSNETCLASNNLVSNAITMTVNPNLTPTVSIAITTGAQTICAGTSVTFTATPVNGGTSPVYQWKVNGVNAGTNSSTFTSTTFANSDIVTCVITSNETCLASNNPVSNAITMTVNPNLTPSVSIAASQTTICAGVSVTFTATPVNGGTSPVYQWKINGVNAGPNSPVFNVSTLANGDIITCVLTSNETCLASNNPTSNSITMTVNPLLTPTISIAIPNATVCAGAFATFTATITNGGATPAYQWKVNGFTAGANSPTFSSASLLTNDIVTCVLTTSVTCYTSLNALSNIIKVTIAPLPVVTLTGTPEILQGGYAQLNSSVSIPVNIYSWTPSFSLDNASIANPIASPDITTLYRLVVTTDAGCKGSNTISVKVVEGPKIANTFTPNNDGIHDFWEIKNLETYPQCRIQVFTRTGQLVFQSIGYPKPWDGNYKGKPLPFDTYYYILELNNRIGSKPITGYVTIVK